MGKPKSSKRHPRKTTATTNLVVKQYKTKRTNQHTWLLITITQTVKNNNTLTRQQQNTITQQNYNTIPQRHDDRTAWDLRVSKLQESRSRSQEAAKLMRTRKRRKQRTYEQAKLKRKTKKKPNARKHHKCRSLNITNVKRRNTYTTQTYTHKDIKTKSTKPYKIQKMESRKT